MRRSNLDIERLITRKLDGELAPEEELELSRIILRDPEAHKLLCRSERIDQVACEALRCAAVGSAPAFDAATLRLVRRERTSHHWGWWLVPAAVAAGLMLMVLFKPVWIAQPGDGVALQRASQVPSATTLRAGLMQALSNSTPIEATQASGGPRRIRRNVDHDLLGVVGEDGRIYWIEVDRMRTIKEPSPPAQLARAVGDL